MHESSLAAKRHKNHPLRRIRAWAYRPAEDLRSRFDFLRLFVAIQIGKNSVAAVLLDYLLRSG
jgi:hypothetical protein